MLELPMLQEAQRQIDVCNACRYCEGVCAVFPALEKMSFLRDGDLTYLANLCHDCRACYYVCPYAPPHEFAIHIPRLLAAVRHETYQAQSWPPWVTRWLAASVWNSLLVALVAAVAVVAAAALGAGIESLFVRHLGPGAFYQVVPWIAMVVPFSLLSLYVLGVMLAGGLRFWSSTRPRENAWSSLGSLWRATADAMTLRYLRGGGPGCNYPGERPSGARLLLHSLVFYGFLSAFAATTTAAIAQDLLGLEPPYPLLSPPVLLGIVGGASMIVGGAGLLALKAMNDSRASVPSMTTMDVAFLALLLLVNASGFGVLVVRSSPAMGTALAIHLGLTATLILTLPYGKFVHLVYRWVSLLRNAAEQMAGVDNGSATGQLEERKNG